MRQQALIAEPSEVAFFQIVIVGVIFACLAPCLRPRARCAHVPAILLAAALATVSLLMLAWAYARGEANYLAPTEYTGVRLGGVARAGWCSASRSSPFTLAGAALIVAGCLIAARAARRRECGGRVLTLTIRPAAPADVAPILRFVRELAEFEREPDAVVATEAMLDDALFGAQPAAEAVIAEEDGAPVGFALFFHNFSTWTGGAGSISRICTSRPRRAGGAWARRCSGISRGSRSTAIARGSNGRCSTGTRRRSTSTRRWAPQPWTNGPCGA